MAAYISGNTSNGGKSVKVVKPKAKPKKATK